MEQTTGATRFLTELLTGDNALTRNWGKAPAIVNGCAVAGTIPAIDEILETPLLRPPYVTLFREQQPIPPETYSREVPVVHSMDADHVLDVGRLRKGFDDGASLKFNRLELWCPPVRSVAEILAQASGREVMVWGFVTHTDAQMLPWHRDTAHNLELQVLGCKRWFLGGPCTEGSSAAYDRLTGPVQSVVTAPDDLLYLPYAYAHCAKAEEDPSFHLSFALQGASVGQVRRRALAYAEDQLDLRSPAEAGAGAMTEALMDVARALRATADRLEEVVSESGQLDAHAAQLFPDSLERSADLG